ncbi:MULTISPECIES: N-acetyl-gamma-glutamyl-phosphate reductase [Veillonella]|uniref:N-acetyl-gamma-glutamyl-phosphate reductase n=1 Tax=Veillonella atypica KON TaxID=1128111 RepID=A0ABN0II87_9FIRM|nr:MULTISPECIES: N-acetyl-gamma-glutamyl-phosphate reductase [Veillonella]EKY17346.1 N-acetyl-gamma-glutamyl-phosphate reductase [Veillonella atypica KON]MBS6648989.1 N-acetyl-gamma-glutamyl-phosphate reductase [Veillonella sp.]PQL16809.1 N-acetyl-gamma-glutamyl-phosphate reductase [Veillonella atypica KON]SUP07055.1 N-acetyl-gamma-glutamyl-phosphate reductase [Veillonella atypica]
MNPYKVFIVGHEGTTGLRIHERLSGRKDITLLSISDEDRKNIDVIASIAKDADIVFLCLPDAASKEVVAAIGDYPCKIIDTSTAFRTADDWAYGFPELGESYKNDIKTKQHIANPGCHASGMIACIVPLVKAGIAPVDYPFTITSLTGYSGGGKKMIGQYESEPKDYFLYAPRQYGLSQQHKHLPEVTHVCGLTETPIFMPIVDDYYSGMEVSVGLHTRLLAKPVTVEDVHAALVDFYKDSIIVKVAPLNLEEDNKQLLNANKLSNTDVMVISVTGNNDRMVVHAIFDNLGKGASGAAVQCMNIALGLPEETGLSL